MVNGKEVEDTFRSFHNWELLIRGVGTVKMLRMDCRSLTVHSRLCSPFQRFREVELERSQGGGTEQRVLLVIEGAGLMGLPPQWRAQTG